nr:MAG TPA: hypothetical protein [Caudoviricetes sp.]
MAKIIYLGTEGNGRALSYWYRQRPYPRRIQNMD